MSSRFALVAGVALAALAAGPLSAQQSTPTAPRDSSTHAPVAKTASDSALVELGRALSTLAASVQTAVEATAKNPEVRRAALQTANQAVAVANKTLVENTDEIQKLLAEASKRLATMAAEQKAKPATPPAQ